MAEDTHLDQKLLRAEDCVDHGLTMRSTCLLLSITDKAIDCRKSTI